MNYIGQAHPAYQDAINDVKRLSDEMRQDGVDLPDYLDDALNDLVAERADMEIPKPPERIERAAKRIAEFLARWDENPFGAWDHMVDDDRIDTTGKVVRGRNFCRAMAASIITLIGGRMEEWIDLTPLEDVEWVNGDEWIARVKKGDMTNL